MDAFDKLLLILIDYGLKEEAANYIEYMESNSIDRSELTRNKAKA